MNDSGIIVDTGNMEQQMKNCYSDLEKILKHYGYTYDDVVAENVTPPIWHRSSGYQVFAIRSIKNNFQRVPGWRLMDWLWKVS